MLRDEQPEETFTESELDRAVDATMEFADESEKIDDDRARAMLKEGAKQVRGRLTGELELPEPEET